MIEVVELMETLAALVWRVENRLGGIPDHIGYAVVLRQQPDACWVANRYRLNPVADLYVVPLDDLVAFALWASGLHPLLLARVNGWYWSCKPRRGRAPLDANVAALRRRGWVLGYRCCPSMRLSP